MKIDFWNKEKSTPILIIASVIVLITLGIYVLDCNPSISDGFIDHRSSGIMTLFFQVATGVIFFILPPIYITTTFLIPKYFITKRYVLFATAAIVTAFLCGYITSYVEPWVDYHVFGVLSTAVRISQSIAVMAFLIIGTVLMNLSLRWFRQIRHLSKIENDQLHMELSILKNQISPHFFFNTLNNLYALSLEQSTATPDVILKLSKMMHYTIYDCKECTVPISSEVQYIENYIALQQIRKKDTIDIKFNKIIDNKQTRIAPMILIVFIENAFKHGVDTIANDAFIKIDLHISDKNVSFSVLNNFAASQSKNDEGIGLKNVSRRLSLLYPNAYSLKNRTEADKYIVNLDIRVV